MSRAQPAYPPPFGAVRSRRSRGALARCLGGLLALLALVGPARSQEPPAREVYGLSAADLGLYLGNHLLAAWRVPEARRVVDGLLAEEPGDRSAQALEAQVLFFEGRYPEALARLDELGSAGPFRDLVAATADATRGFRSRQSAHFEVSWGDPRDEVLVGPALEALEAARGALSRELGFLPEGRVRLEIYPNAASFTAVSTLTRQEVETSGTIGLCKFDRLMITTPRATVWGYRWRDTLCHEYVHLALYRLTHGTAPIWVHEGVAKYLEASWRGVVGELGPSSQALLARRLEAGTLIALEAMSPSVAKLPSAEDTALAFAQVGTMMSFLEERRGPGALRRLAGELGLGTGDREALEEVWGDTFPSFEDAWLGWAAGLPLEREAVQVLSLELADHGRAPDEEPAAFGDPRARDYARLGDLLRARGRLGAAAVEYGKAYALAPAAPGVASRYALGLLSAGRFGEAAQVAVDGLRHYPDLPVLWYRKGEALLSLGRHREAAAALEELLEINPFHVPARKALLHAARASGDAPLAAREEWALGVLER
ncbi:MAG: tetratricopeptide repeat protein [Deferrisomatales bacterium]